MRLKWLLHYQARLHYLAQDAEQFVVPCSLKVQHDFNELFIMINNYHQFRIGKSNIKKINFHIFKMNITEIQNQTKYFASCKH